MKLLIVEDEAAALNNIVEIIAEVDPTAEVVGITESIVSTEHWLLTNAAPDIIIMDIHLADGPAFEIFDRVKISTPVIFTTAYDEYALKAFKTHAIDYLLKPIKVRDMRQALEKFRDIKSQAIISYIERVNTVKVSNKYAERMLVAYRDKLIPVNTSAISFFFTASNKTTIYLSDGSKYNHYKPLESILQTLNPAQFFRANRQFVLSKDKIKDIVVWPDSRLAIAMDITTPETIFISKNRASDFRKWIIEE